MIKEDVQDLFYCIEDEGVDITLLSGYENWDHIDSRVFQKALLDFKLSRIKMEDALESLGNLFGLKYDRG